MLEVDASPESIKPLGKRTELIGFDPPFSPVRFLNRGKVDFIGNVPFWLEHCPPPPVCVRTSWMVTKTDQGQNEHTERERMNENTTNARLNFWYSNADQFVMKRRSINVYRE